MFPAVAEIVSVGEAANAGLHNADQSNTVFIGDVVNGAPITIVPPINVEDMEMAVFPSHRRLDRTVKVSEGHCVEHEKPAPYGRLGSEQRHLDANYGFAHAGFRRTGLGHGSDVL